MYRKNRITRSIKCVLRKILGIALAIGGISIIVDTLPTYLWFVLLGALFIWLGWILYGIDNRRWI